MSPSGARGPTAGCAGPQAELGTSQARHQGQSREQTSWDQHQRPASLSLQAPGRSGAEGGSEGAAGPPCAWGRLSLSFSQPKGLQRCC